MRAWIVESFADTPPMVLREVPVPMLRLGHALVRVKALGVNYADSLAIRGKYQVRHALPMTAGSELSGEVTAVADEDARSWIGQRVMAQVDGGAAAEYCLVPLGRLRKAPDKLSEVATAAISVTYPTAHLALFEERKLGPGDMVLVHAGAGGVGSAAIQLAARVGATVIATAGSDEKVAIARSLGATHAISYRREDWDAEVARIAGDRGIDVVVDVVGGETAKRSLRLLAWRGRYAIVGFASGEIPKFAANHLLTRAAKAAGVWWSPEKDRALLEKIHADLSEGFASGGLDPLIGTVEPFENYDRAVDLVASGQSIGKVVVRL